MAQAMVNFRMDADLKKSMEQTCQEMGMSMTTAFTIFATKVSIEKRIPFEISADPFYSESNMKHLRRLFLILTQERRSWWNTSLSKRIKL